ncbi:MAG: glutamine--fructose-6-phosphate aminotransferase, partial [Firmicutes bacterium]|nr:glutamine--fructose-6-phosphate aminotransferase [Bacillota bacterium]
MCGIVGDVAAADTSGAKDIIINGLRRLEYRGYDSSGIALYKDGKFETRKSVGGLENLEKLVDDPEF